jgi:hypothetical protein
MLWKYLANFEMFLMVIKYPKSFSKQGNYCFSLFKRLLKSLQMINEILVRIFLMHTFTL